MSAFTPRRVGREAMLDMFSRSQHGWHLLGNTVMSRAVAVALSEAGLVQYIASRNPDAPGRRRLARVSLTDAGRQMCRKWIVDAEAARARDIAKLVLP